MSSFKGRHLGFLVVLCIGWSAARVVIVVWESADSEQMVTAVTAPGPLFAKINELNTTPRLKDTGPTCCFPTAGVNRPDIAAARTTEARTTFGRIAVQDIAGNVASDFMREPISAPSGKLRSDISAIRSASPPVHRSSLRADAYAYSFLRAGNGRGSLATGGQYGGSQSGVIATFSLRRAGDVGKAQMLALLVRAAVAHDNIDEREVAFGVRWRPVEELPVSVTAERRFRHDRKDAFAIYAAGGVSDVQLPLKFRADSFAQAGLVSGKEAGPFFDAFVRADREVVQVSGIAVHAGGGAWAGGQRGAARLDIGPSLRTDIRVHDARLRLNLDWRFRVAGSATPGNGPALTLSTGF